MAFYCDFKVEEEISRQLILGTHEVHLSSYFGTIADSLS